MGARTYFFGTHRLDTARRIVYSGATPTPISERLFRLLLALIEAEGSVVDRATLSQRVWGEDGVTDTNMTQHVYLLRELLGEQKNEHRYVVTIPGKGYRFAAPVSVAPTGDDELAAEAWQNGERFFARNPGLLQHYCRGSYFVDRRTAPALRAAVDAFRAALAIEPACVPALVGLARAWILLAEYWHEPAALAVGEARSAIDRALQLDPRSPAALATLSEIQLCGQLDWLRSKDSLDSSLTFDPTLTLARNNAAWFHLYRGDFDRAAFEAKEALFTQPSSLPLQLLVARVLLHSGLYREAIDAMSTMLEDDPYFFLARRFLALAFILDGRPDLAVEQILSVPADPSEDSVYRLPLLARAFADLGEKDRALQAYERLHDLAGSEYVNSWNLAIVAASVERDEEAMAHLQTAQRERNPALLLLRIVPLFGSTAKRAEFRTLLAETRPQ